MSKITKTKINTRRFIQETVVVEGRTDTQKLQKLFEVKTIETNGSALDQKTINLIKLASETTGVILFLDPDYQGNKIRNEIVKHLTKFKECYVSKKNMNPKSLKIGIAEATDDAILNAFNNYLHEYTDSKLTISWHDYLTLNLATKAKRQIVCDYFKIAYCNHKQLYKRLNMMQITKGKIVGILHESK